MKRHQPRDCAKTLQLLDDFISGELSVESNRQILSHLEHCAACGNEQQARQQMRESLRQAWKAQQSPQGLQERILSGLEASPGVTPHLRRVAGFVLATLALYLIWQFFPLTASAVDHYYQAVQDHFRCEESDRPEAPLPIPVSSPELNQVLASVPGDYVLRVGHNCQAEGIEFVHYVFVSASLQSRFSVVLEVRSPDETLAPREDLARQIIDNLEVSVLSHERATLVAFETDRHFVYLVSEADEQEQALALARSILPALNDLL